MMLHVSRPNTYAFLVTAFLCAAFFSAEAQAGKILIKDGHWRLELQGMIGTNGGKGDHADDMYVVGQVEYEVPAFRRSAFGLKIIPLFLFDQDDQDTGEKDTIVGGGIGVAYRIYQHAESRDGFYLEGSISVLFHSPRFEDNTGDINFLSEVGLGYKFENAWHVAVKWEHISNGSTSRKNAGVNSVGLGVGKTF
jgi:hypothetical protein